ncbi:MAG: hypothetical protein IJJ50_05260 [Lachnospiraceae bacterium]|nr:hypothetical protein [Lachnospiraceae bacterium]
MSAGARRSKRESHVLRIKILLAAAVLIFAFLLIFATDAIRVTGNHHVTGNEVRAMFEEQKVSSNTVLLYLYNLVRPIRDRNFIDHVTLRFAGPRTLVAEVHEKQLAGYFESNGKYWYFDRLGVIEAGSDMPETLLEEGKPYIPLVGGLTAGSPALGDPMPAADTGFYEKLGNLQTVLSREHLIPDTVYVDEEYDVYLTYGKITVELGDLNSLEARMHALSDILPNTEGMEGTLLLGDYDGSEDVVVFRKKEKETVKAEEIREESEEDGAAPDPSGEAAEEPETTGEEGALEDGEAGREASGSGETAPEESGNGD